MRGARSKKFWVISEVGAGRVTVLTAGLAGGRPTLPVFSFAQEAEAYLGPERDGWRVMETAVGELVSMLSGPYAGVGRVLLDPPPRLDARLLSDLVGVERGAFVEYLLGPARGRGPASYEGGRAWRSRPRPGAAV